MLCKGFLKEFHSFETVLRLVIMDTVLGEVILLSLTVVQDHL